MCSTAQSYLTLCDPKGWSLPGSCILEFSRQNYWSGLPFPLPVDLPNPGIEPTSPALTGRFFTTVPPKFEIYPLTKVSVWELWPHTSRNPGGVLPTCISNNRQRDLHGWGPCSGLWTGSSPSWPLYGKQRTLTWTVIQKPERLCSNLDFQRSSSTPLEERNTEFRADKRNSLTLPASPFLQHDTA